MKEFTKAKFIDFGARLAKAGLIAAYPPRSHSHNIFSLFWREIATRGKLEY